MFIIFTFHTLVFQPLLRKRMATATWLAALDKKEHKNWVMVGCALNIAKNGITQVIQGKMETWYQSLVSSPPLRSLGPCSCALGSSKCVRCVTWETELKRHHKSRRPVICWGNSDRTQWGSPTGAWEVAKVFMPTLGRRKRDVTDACTTDISGLLNLLEWCPFINPPVSRSVLSSARGQCRNHWAHAPKQELQDADVNTIFGHLNSLLSDPVFNADKAAQKSSKDLQDLFHHGLVNIRNSEVEALVLLRQSLEADLTKCCDDLSDFQDKIVQMDAEAKKVNKSVKKEISEVKEQGDLNREEVVKLKQQLGTEVKKVETDLNEKISKILNAVEEYNKLLNERDDLNGALDLISEDVDNLTRGVQNVAVELDETKTQVANLGINLESVKGEVNEVANELVTNRKTISGLQKDFLVVKEEVETLKAKPPEVPNSDDSDALCTAPSRLTAFTGREEALMWLEQTLALNQSFKSHPGTSCRFKAICGLGGCGKTSLAVELVWRYKNHFPGGVFWINGESDENISISVVENLALLNIPASSSEKVDDTLNRFLASLSKKERPWLLVVDNADELQDSTCPTGVRKICKGPWQRNGNASKHGNILLTTRQTVNDTKTFLKLPSDDCLELKCFSEAEGALFLMQRTGANEEALDQEAVNLSNELGALPLALEQAAAYITALPIPCSFKAYLEKYRAVKLSLLERQPVTAFSIEAQHRLSVHTTWLMNFEFVRNKSPAAAAMMRIAAFLESENIPTDVINPGYPYLDQAELRKSVHSEIDIADLLKVLSLYSLFSVDLQSRVFGMHKLVQEVVRDSLTTSERREAIVAATRVLHFALKAASNNLCNNLEKHYYLLSLSEMKEQGRNVLIGLLLNFRKLKNHMKEEIKLSKEDGHSTSEFIDKYTLDLCAFVCHLSENDLSLVLLHAELSEFYLNVTKVVRGDTDPNLILRMMVKTSIAKRNYSASGSYIEAKTLANETVTKMFECERSGLIINNDTKFKVLEHRASFYATEKQWKANYQALLELEGLPTEKDDIISLQLLIARAEKYASACNFPSALRRYEKALQLARETYPCDHPKLLFAVQHMATFLHGGGKIQEAKPYAEEMIEIARKQPLDSEYYIKGMVYAYSVLKEFDACNSEEKLLAILNERWPRIYNSLTDDRVATNAAVIEDGSDDHLALVLEVLLDCFYNISIKLHGKAAKRDLVKKKGKLYLKVAQMLLSIRKKFYGEKHPALKDAYLYLIAIHSFLGNTKQVTEFREHLNQCEQEAPSQFYQNVPSDYNVAVARMLKEPANHFFKSGNYSDALKLYSQMLYLSPNDAKLLTNRASAYIKLSQQRGQNSSGNINLALQDSQNAISADPSWVKGYYWKAVCLAHLGKRGPSLAAAGVAKHLFPSQCAKISAIVDRFGSYDVQVVTTVQELCLVTERTNTQNLVIVVKEGRYELPSPLNIPKNTVMIGLGTEIQITCLRGAPLKLDKTAYMENISLSPTMESITRLKEKAKECLDHGQVEEALSLYSQALMSCQNNPQILTSRASAYLRSAQLKKDISAADREDLLELALKDAEAAITSDPTWLVGYHTKATILADLDRKQQALAAAAVFKHLSTGRDVPKVAKRYGGLLVHAIESSEDLRSVFQRIRNLEGVHQIVLIKEGEYLLERSVEIPQPIIIVGQGKVKVSCKIGSSFCFTQAGYVENVETVEDCDNQQQSKDHVTSDSQSEVISLATPSGYEHMDNECKVN